MKENGVERGKEYPRLYSEKSECCGCGACMLICPLRKNGEAGAISMQRDEEGFLYPCLDETKCIKCYKCLSVCPMK